MTRSTSPASKALLAAAYEAARIAARPSQPAPHKVVALAVEVTA